MLVSVPYAFKAHEKRRRWVGCLRRPSSKAAPSDTNNVTSVNALATNGTLATGAASAGMASQQLFTCTGCTAGNIPVVTDAAGDLTTSLMSQAVTGATVVNDSGSFNLSNSATGFYQIWGANVLGTGIPSTPSNVYVGPNAGYYNYTYATGGFNTYVGNAACLNCEGSYNTAMGVSAGWSGSTAGPGSSNTFMGYGAGDNTTSGNGNSAFGLLRPGSTSPRAATTWIWPTRVTSARAIRIPHRHRRPAICRRTLRVSSITQQPMRQMCT